MRLYIYGAIALALAWTHWLAYSSGKDAILSKLAADRITILKDGKEIDNDVLAADDDELCAILGGCVPDNGAE